MQSEFFSIHLPYKKLGVGIHRFALVHLPSCLQKMTPDPFTFLSNLVLSKHPSFGVSNDEVLGIILPSSCFSDSRTHIQSALTSVIGAWFSSTSLQLFFGSCGVVDDQWWCGSAGGCYLHKHIRTSTSTTPSTWLQSFFCVWRLSSNGLSLKNIGNSLDAAKNWQSLFSPVVHTLFCFTDKNTQPKK